MVERIEISITHGQVFDFDHLRTLFARSTNKRNGAPTKAVMTPIGNSAGDSKVRAPRSARTKNAAPDKATVNNARLVARFVSPRTKCGTTIPTKPIRPLADTAVAVASVAAPIAMILTQVFNRTPMNIATMSMITVTDRLITMLLTCCTIQMLIQMASELESEFRVVQI